FGFDPVYYNGYKAYVDSVRGGPTATPSGPTNTPTSGPSPTPTRTPTSTATPPPTATPTNTAAPGAGIHVSNINMYILLQGNHEAHAEVTIVDQAGQPVSGATVSGHWDVNNLNQNIVTNASGL